MPAIILANMGGAADAYGMMVLGFISIGVAAFVTLCMTWVICLERDKGWKWYL